MSPDQGVDMGTRASQLDSWDDALQPDGPTLYFKIEERIEEITTHRIMDDDEVNVSNSDEATSDSGGTWNGSRSSTEGFRSSEKLKWDRKLTPSKKTVRRVREVTHNEGHITRHATVEESLLPRVNFPVLSDPVVAFPRRVSFPELGADLINEDDLDGEPCDRAPGDLILDSDSWEDNWLFRRHKLVESAPSVCRSGSVSMLIPNPSSVISPTVGSRGADELSDLSEQHSFSSGEPWSTSDSDSDSDGKPRGRTEKGSSRYHHLSVHLKNKEALKHPVAGNFQGNSEGNFQGSSAENFQGYSTGDFQGNSEDTGIILQPTPKPRKASLNSTLCRAETIPQSTKSAPNNVNCKKYKKAEAQTDSREDCSILSPPIKVPTKTKESPSSSESVWFISMPEDCSVAEGRALRLHCQLNGLKPFGVSWYHQGHLLTADELRRMWRNGSQYHLQIYNFSSQKAGTYAIAAYTVSHCVWAFCHVSYKEIQRPLKPPALTKGFSNLAAEEGGEISLECQITGHPEPVVTFYKNSKIIQPTSKIFIDTDIYGGWSVRLAKITKEDAGVYKAMASNIMGEVTTKCHLNILPEGILTNSKRNEPLKEQANNSKISSAAMPPLSQRKSINSAKGDTIKSPSISNVLAQGDSLKGCTVTASDESCGRNGNGEGTICSQGTEVQLQSHGPSAERADSNNHLVANLSVPPRPGILMFGDPAEDGQGHCVLVGTSGEAVTLSGKTLNNGLHEELKSPVKISTTNADLFHMHDYACDTDLHAYINPGEGEHVNIFPCSQIVVPVPLDVSRIESHSQDKLKIAHTDKQMEDQIYHAYSFQNNLPLSESGSSGSRIQVNREGHLDHPILNSDEKVRCQTVTTVLQPAVSDDLLNPADISAVPGFLLNVGIDSDFQLPSNNFNKPPVAGTIAEREHRKWLEAAPLPNNPYSPDRLVIRLSQTSSRNLLPKAGSYSVEATLEENEQDPADDVHPQVDLSRYCRDYHINTYHQEMPSSPSHQKVQETHENKAINCTSGVQANPPETPATTQHTNKENINNEKKLVSFELTNWKEDLKDIKAAHVEREVARFQKSINEAQRTWEERLFNQGLTKKSTASSGSSQHICSSSDELDHHLRNYSCKRFPVYQNRKIWRTESSDTLGGSCPGSRETFSDSALSHQIFHRDTSIDSLRCSSDTKDNRVPLRNRCNFRHKKLCDEIVPVISYLKNTSVMFDSSGDKNLGRSEELWSEGKKQFGDKIMGDEKSRSHSESTTETDTHDDSNSERGGILRLPSVRELAMKFDINLNKEFHSRLRESNYRWSRRNVSLPYLSSERSHLKEVHSLTARSVPRSFREGLRENLPRQANRNIIAGTSCTSSVPSRNTPSPEHLGIPWYPATIPARSIQPEGDTSDDSLNLMGYPKRITRKKYFGKLSGSSKTSG